MSDRYLKIVEWSGEDKCYIGRAPALMYGGCDGDDQLEVYRQLCEIVDDVIEEYCAQGTPLPPSDVELDVVSMIRERLNMPTGWETDKAE